jgi:hypothetical protein
MLEYGASKRDAALVAFGSTVGMFTVDRFLHLGELFFNDLEDVAGRALRQTAINEAKNLASTVFKETVSTGNKAKNFVLKGINAGKNVANNFVQDLKYHTTGFLGKAIGEGIEEVSEELVTDFTKQLYEWAGEFSPNIIN